MKQRYLLLGVMWFAFASFHSILLAEESSAATTVDLSDNQIVLVEGICDLVLCGYSADEIAIILAAHQSDSNNIQKLVAKIHTLLQGQHSKEEMIKLIAHDNDEDEDRRKQNFWKSLKNGYFVFKLILVIGVTAGVSYYLYQWLQANGWSLFKIKLPLPLGEQKKSDDSKDPVDLDDLNSAQPKDNAHKEPERVLEEPKDQEPAQDSKSGHHDLDESDYDELDKELSPAKRRRLAEILSDEYEAQKDVALFGRVREQIERAKALGYIPD